MLNKSAKKPKLAVVGVVPPPFGGVSVHVLREIELIRNAGFEADLYEQRGKSDSESSIFPLSGSKFGFLRFLLTVKCDLVHFHFCNHLASAIVGVILLFRPGFKYMCTVHGECIPKAWKGGSWWFRKLLQLYLRRAAAIVSVNPEVATFIEEEIGVAANKVSIIPAFLPPSQAELEEENIPNFVSDFIEGKTVVGTHGWFGFFQDNVHVYGFDMIAKLVEMTAERDVAVVFYTVISGSYDDLHRSEIFRMQEPFKDRWLIIEDSFTCASLYGKSDVFIRPTYTDGDSVSIRECLALGVPVIASDAVSRPKECHVFKSRNQESLESVFLELLPALVPEKLTPVEFGFDQMLVNVINSAVGQS